MNYAEALAWLYGTQLHGIKLGLENIARLTRELGIHTGGTSAPRFLHVAGTNGKGSVCAMLDSICRAGGRRTGLFTSPHLVTFRERIRVDGAMISEDEVARGLSEIRELVARWEHSPTFFEITTALALAHFQRSGAEVVVLETGMGGRLDATNIVTPAVSVITRIDYDHQQFLGSSLAEIAAEKAGILKPEAPAVSAPQEKEVAEVLRARAEQTRTLYLYFVDQPWEGAVNLAGSHQLWNASLAVDAVIASGLGLTADAITEGLESVEWPGRFQRVGERFVLDGAHNPGAAAQLAATWREIHGDERATVIAGILRDKDVRGICAELGGVARRVIAVPVQNERTSAAADLAELVRALDPSLDCVPAQNLPTAIDMAAQFPEHILITGSLFLVGEALAYFQGEGERREPSTQ